ARKLINCVRGIPPVACVLMLSLATPAYGVKIDPSVDRDQCVSTGGIPQFQLQVVPNAPDPRHPAVPTGSQLVSLYTGCLTPDDPGVSPPDNPCSNPTPGGPCGLPGGPVGPLGPVIDLSVDAPRNAPSGSDITSRVHITATNNGDHESPKFAIQLFLVTA